MIFEHLVLYRWITQKTRIGLKLSETYVHKQTFTWIRDSIHGKLCHRSWHKLWFSFSIPFMLIISQHCCLLFLFKCTKILTLASIILYFILLFSQLYHDKCIHTDEHMHTCMCVLIIYKHGKYCIRSNFWRTLFMKNLKTKSIFENKNS